MSVQAAKALRWLPVFRRWPALVHHVGLQARIAFLVAAGLLALVAIFVVLGLSALRTSTDRELGQRALLAELAAVRLDSLLAQTSMSASWAAAELVDPLRTGDIARLSAILATAKRQIGPRRLDDGHLDETIEVWADDEIGETGASAGLHAHSVGELHG